MPSVSAGGSLLPLCVLSTGYHRTPHAMDLSQGLLVTFGDMLFPDVVCHRSDMERGSEPMFGLTLFNLYTRGQGDQSEEDRSSCF